MSSRIKEDVQKIFEFWCEVTKAENSQKIAGHIIESFPESFRDDSIISKIPDFAYPCEFENESVQSYSFVLTSDDSKWRFGFCRHDPKTQTAMVIITYLPWHDTFLRLLSVLGELRRTKNGEFESFLAEAYNKGIPDPGANLKLFYNAGQNHFIFQRPSQFQLPSIPENHNLNLYYNFVDPKNMTSVFAAMLAERRIIFTSRRLDKLSSCVQASNAFLYPMVWQHIFIPVLPMKFKDILSAPMPYLIGVPEAVLLTMTPEELGDVVTLNCDSKTFDSPFDDLRYMPSELVSQMKKLLNNSNDHIGDRVSKIFLGILVQLIGGYRDAVRFTNGQKITWDRDLFIETRPTHLRPFLIRMMELQIFQQFIDERIDMLNTGLGFSDEFELETLRYAEKLGKRGRNYKEFLRNVKDKTNPAVKSAVKSVKESSKGVKTVYKDLKSKFRDVTPPTTSQFHSHIGSQNQQHRSAPNSPVFSKRQTNIEFNGRKVLATSTSNTQFQSNINSNSSGLTSYANHRVINNLPIINNHLTLSPAISPSNSVCSSDMNLTQELQNHPLFKSPTVDRSLKPCSSLEYGHRLNIRSGAQLITPSFSSSTLPATISRTPGNLELNEQTVEDLNLLKKDTSTSVFPTDSIFDSPPDMPSPPVPPRRTNTNRNSNKKITNCNLPPPPPLNIQQNNHQLIGFENNFVTNNTDNCHDEIDSKDNLSSLAISNNMVNNIQQAPVPIPRQKFKEPQNSPKLPNLIETTVTEDLIKLDEMNNSSFDIEDFDPLNVNAKPIPNLPIQSTNGNANNLQTSLISENQSIKSMYLPSSSSANQMNGCTIPTVHNPIYPYFTPQHHRHNQTSMPAASSFGSENKTNDFELLKKYGLDQFTLTVSNNTLPAVQTGGEKIGNSNKKLNDGWTTFD